MKLLGELIENIKKTYKHTFKRFACRAIIFDQENLVMIYSKKYNDYKIPGGGIMEDEDKIECLFREVKEETGIILDENSIVEVGVFRELRPSNIEEDTVFDQTSYYYMGKIKEDTKLLNLEDYEKDAGFEVIRIKPEIALKENLKANRPYSKRENEILKIILENELWKYYM